MIIKHPNPILFTKSDLIDNEFIETDEFKQIALEMKDEIERTNAVGISAIQIGIPKSMFIAVLEDKKFLFINPIILRKSEEIITATEGCLSFPGLFIKRQRSKKILLHATLSDFEKTEPFERWVDGFPSVILQHETEHCNGETFVSDFSLTKRDMILRKYHKKLKHLDMKK